MQEKIINQFGDKTLYIEKNLGNVYLANNYTRDSASAFASGSDELLGYTPTISPEIPRQEVDLIQRWIEGKSDVSDSSTRLALLYGKAGIGKSIVMHKLLESLQEREDYLILGIKSDLVEFANMDDLRGKMYLTKPIEDVIREEASKRKRVVFLVDQIDALSLTLSANRTPLRSLLGLIRRIANIPHVRVVISCRPYDLQYDPELQNLKIKNRWELKELSVEQVLQTLRSNGRNENIDDRLITFLGNPLHLYLFLKVNLEERLTDPLSTNLLYHQLWSKYISNMNTCPVDKNSLLSLLDTLVDTMYRRQELSVHIRELETQYEQELRYLLTNGFLIESKSRQIQFFHQTLFDYVYARRFLEKGRSILEQLQGQHQGLFIRASVKSILMFLREQNPKEYLNTLENLLYRKDDNGLSTFRFHLKSLALHLFAHFETPLPNELDFISRKVYSNPMYMELVFNSVYTTNWFHAIWGIIDKGGGWQGLSQAYQKQAIEMCRRVLWRDVDSVLDRLNIELDFEDEEDRKYLEQVLNFYELDYNGGKFLELYSKLVKGRNPLQYTNLLSTIIQGDPTFVCAELKENIRLQLQESKDTFFSKISVSHDVGELYNKLLKKHYSLAIDFLFDILTLICEATSYQIEEAEDNIHLSYSFWNFHRTIQPDIHENFTEGVINILIDSLLEHINEEKTHQYILQLSKSRHGGFVFIALYIYTSHPEIFKDHICELICQRDVLANAPSWVEYQAIEALKASFGYLTEKQKKSILDRILTIHDKSEYKLDRKRVEWSRKFGHPFLDIDLHQGTVLKAIPINELRHISWRAYQERLRIERKFHPERLDNYQPAGISSHWGYPSLTREQVGKMSIRNWRRSMRQYISDINFRNWNQPTLSGQSERFREAVSLTPDKFTDLIKEIAQDETIPMAYPMAGLKGLIEADKIDDAMCILQYILAAVNQDINSDHRGFCIRTLLFTLDSIVKQDHIPELVVQLLCQTLLDAREPQREEYQKDQDAITIGINQPRGQAGRLLVRCAREDSRYKEDIFSVIEAVADTSSVYTRAAILMEMALLNFWDQDRNVRLFKKLMYDYDPRLMALPVHNYNPLVYFVNYALEELMEFFGHVIECPDCYLQQVIILFLAWSHNNRDERIKKMLDIICNASQEARLSLLSFLGSVKQDDEDILFYILRLMNPKFDSPELGKACDQMFYHIEKWSQASQVRVAGAYISTTLYRHKIRGFIHFLGGYALKDPRQTLEWLEKILRLSPACEAYIWNQIVEIIIQAYNGAKTFNHPDYQEALEYAMDLIDRIMQHPSNRYMISNFMNKLDNE